MHDLAYERLRALGPCARIGSKQMFLLLTLVDVCIHWEGCKAQGVRHRACGPLEVGGSLRSRLEAGTFGAFEVGGLRSEATNE